MECAVVLERAAPHVRVAVALTMNTGLDPSDALKLTRRQIDGNTIWGVRAKTGQEVAIPIGPTLQKAPGAAPAHDAVTILANFRGKPWTCSGFKTVWKRLRRQLEAEGAVEPGLTPKGLRHTVATTLCEAGLEERQIADLLGQENPSMALHYSRSANLEDRNQPTMEILQQANERRKKVVKPFPTPVSLRKAQR